MGVRRQQATRLAAALALTIVPVAAGPFAQAVPVADTSDNMAAGSDVTAAWAALDAASGPHHTTVPAQTVAPRTVIAGKLVLKTAKERNRKVTISSSKGAQTFTASTLSDHNIPTAALLAYRHAAAAESSADPSCHIPWWLLAGIGRIESDHGQYGGSVLGADGVSRPAIIGVALNGAGPFAAVPDTDNGRLDGDKVWDHAVGPMQFLPSTWAWAGRDGDGDGVKNPQDINDAALAAAAYLCGGISGSILQPASMRTAIFHYNPSDYYVALVEAFAKGYQTGVFAIPSPPPPAAAHHHARHKQADSTRHRKHHKQAGNRKHHASGGSTGGAKPSGSGTKPSAGGTSTAPSTGGSSSSPTPKPPSGGGSSPTPTPTPSPSPTPKPTPSPSPSPAAVSLSGTWSTCGTGWCVAGQPLDLGPTTQLNATAAYDFDGDGTVEANADEFAGLVGANVTITGQQTGSNPVVVFKINGHAYRTATNTFALVSD
jgi:membrane-bound lytic murein transglycosylase B